MKLQALGLAALIGAATCHPAIADWQYYEQLGSSGIWQSDTTGAYELELGCVSEAILSLGVYSNELLAAGFADEDPLPLEIRVEGRPPAAMTGYIVTTADGRTGATVLDIEDSRARDVIASILQTTQPVEVIVLDQSVTFDMTGMSEARASMADCSA